MVSWFNRTRISEQDKQLKTIPGAFYKVRANGSVADHDCNDLNKFYKRAGVTCGVGMVHSFVLVQFLYQSKLLTKANTPHMVFQYTPYVVYPVAVLGIVGYIFFENQRIQDKLDSKYTPLWVRMTEQSSLIKKN